MKRSRAALTKTAVTGGYSRYHWLCVYKGERGREDTSLFSVLSSAHDGFAPVWSAVFGQKGGGEEKEERTTSVCAASFVLGREYASYSYP